MNDVTDISSRVNIVHFMEATCANVYAHKYHFTNETDLQDGLAMVLGKEWEREYHLNSKDRLDFYESRSGVCIEVKLDGGLSALIRQIHRYTQDDKISGVLVVTPMAGLTRFPSMMNGKPVMAVHLATSVF